MTLDDLDGRLFAYVSEVAQILGRDQRTVRAAIRAGQIPATKTGQRYIVRVSWLREQAGSAAVPSPAAVPDLEELADRVADRLFARFIGLFAGRPLGAESASLAAGAASPAAAADEHQVPSKDRRLDAEPNPARR